MNIFLVRHGQSSANVDPTIYEKIPDCNIPLSQYGINQAYNCGKDLFNFMINADERICSIWDKTVIYTSPYKRAKQTAEYMVDGLNKGLNEYRNMNFYNKNDIQDSIFLVEQQFGLFDGLFVDDDYTKIKEKYPNEWAYYEKHEKHNGKFWARMPMGESRFDVAIRVQQFFGNMINDCKEYGYENVIIVTHGVTIRCFLMQWLNKNVEWFDTEHNPKNCSVRYIENTYIDNGYIL